MTRFFTGISVIGLIAGGVSIGHAQTLPEQVALPKNIHVLDARLRPAVIELLAVSPTFKRQCDTIGATPNVHVTIGKPSGAAVETHPLAVDPPALRHGAARVHRAAGARAR